MISFDKFLEQLSITTFYTINLLKLCSDPEVVTQSCSPGERCYADVLRIC